MAELAKVYFGDLYRTRLEVIPVIRVSVPWRSTSRFAQPHGTVEEENLINDLKE